MPFDYKSYEQRCLRMSKDELRREVAHQNEVVASAGAGTGLAVLAIPLTMGLSAIALGGTGPAIINARKKRSIARKHFESSRPEVVSSPSSSTQQNRFKLIRLDQPGSSEPDEQLPAYAPRSAEPDNREKQVFVPIEDSEIDLPPAYNDVTIKRKSVMAPQLPHLSSGQWSLGAIEEHTSHGQLSRQSTTELDTPSSHASSSSRSLYQANYHPESRVISPDHDIAPVNVLQDEDVMSPSKGKNRSNPFRSPEDPDVVHMHA